MATIKLIGGPKEGVTFQRDKLRTYVQIPALDENTLMAPPGSDARKPENSIHMIVYKKWRQGEGDSYLYKFERYE